MRNANYSYFRALTLGGLCLAFSIAHGSNLIPGGSVNSIPVDSYGLSQFLSGGPSNDTSGVTAVNGLLPQSAGAAAGSNLASIYFEDASYTDPITGYLDFFYQIQNLPLGTSIDSDTVALSTIDDCTLPGAAITGVEQITSASFTSFDGFVQPSSPTNNISSVSLDSKGQILTLNFDSNISPGQSSAILVIQTNAGACNQNGQGAIDEASVLPVKSGQGAGGQSGDAPLASPEPGVYVALPLGVFAVCRRTKLAGSGAGPWPAQ
jgi:hypothetical protein